MGGALKQGYNAMGYLWVEHALLTRDGPRLEVFGPHDWGSPLGPDLNMCYLERNTLKQRNYCPLLLIYLTITFIYTSFIGYLTSLM